MLLNFAVDDIQWLGTLVLAALAGALFLRLWELSHREPPPGPKQPYAEPVPLWSNRPRPPTYFVNSRGHKLFYEVHGPRLGDPKCKSLIFLNVGYTAHVMRPLLLPLLNALAAGECCVAIFDWAGAGYSGGTRCLVDKDGMLEDLEQFVHMIHEGADAGGATVPWFCMGQSMAGAVALLFSHRAWARRCALLAKQGAAPNDALNKERRTFNDTSNAASFYAHFSGCICSAPLVTMALPPAPVLAVFQLVARLFPTCLMPRSISGSLPDEAVWPSHEVISWHMTHDVSFGVRAFGKQKVEGWFS